MQPGESRVVQRPLAWWSARIHRDIGLAPCEYTGVGVRYQAHIAAAMSASPREVDGAVITARVSKTDTGQAQIVAT